MKKQTRQRGVSGAATHCGDGGVEELLEPLVSPLLRVHRLREGGAADVADVERDGAHVEEVAHPHAERGAVLDVSELQHLRGAFSRRGLRKRFQTRTQSGLCV